MADNQNRPITMPVSADCYLLCIMIALDTEIILVIYANVLVALFSYALVCCIIQ